MNTAQYETESEDDCIFIFISAGKTNITKIIQYQGLDLRVSDENEKEFELYNLGFGDYNKDTGKIDDKVSSNNGDSKQVFNTVLNTIPKFITSKRAVGIAIQGSDNKRHKIYHRFLSAQIDNFIEDY